MFFVRVKLPWQSFPWKFHRAFHMEFHPRQFHFGENTRKLHDNFMENKTEISKMQDRPDFV